MWSPQEYYPGKAVAATTNYPVKNVILSGGVQETGPEVLNSTPFDPALAITPALGPSRECGDASANRVSLFSNAKEKSPIGEITIRDFISEIKSGKHAAAVERVRSAVASKNPDQVSAEKRKLRAVSISGCCTGLRAKAFDEGRFTHSGWLQLDFDGDELNGYTPVEVRDMLGKDAHVQASFLSPSGEGAKGLLRVPACSTPAEHKQAFIAAENYLREKYGLTLDPSTKDPVRLCYFSHDPDARWNPAAAVPLTIPPPEIKTASTPPLSLGRKRKSGSAFPEPPEHGIHVWVIKVAWHCLRSGMSKSDTIALLESYNGRLRRRYQPNEVINAVDKVYATPVRDQVPRLTVPPVTPAESGKRLSDFLVDHSDTLHMSWEEIEGLRPPTVIDGFLRQGEVLLLGAESKSRKSWLTQDAGFAVAAGLPWLADEDGSNGFATSKARVHVFDLELNPAEMRYRFAKARKNRFSDSPADAAAMTEAIASYSLDGLNVVEIMQRLEELKATVEPGDLVIVDCLYRLCPDGNETLDVANILETIKRFASETQAGVILVDHFRKAGDDKARNRFAGSFVKQASASTLVAIEVTADDVLVLNIDARTFHGCSRVHARFNSDTYAFDRVPDSEVESSRQGKALAEAEGWLSKLWHSRPWDFAMTAADAGERWNIKRQSATPRLRKLVSRGWLVENSGGAGKTIEWRLTPAGHTIIKTAHGLTA